MGEKLKFYLSLGLFSSFSVDAGTRLLLKTLAQQKILPTEGKILDSGCGTGIIAVSLKKKFPDLDITALDRDALALKFTGMNAALNNLPVEGFSLESGLLPGSIETPFFPETSALNTMKYDLIISNIPAKAGSPVIEDFLSNCAGWLTDDGKVAVVIVASLTAAAEESLRRCGAVITHKEADAQYTVFHFIPGNSAGRAGKFTDIYQRTSGRVNGFFGLPDFDSISYQTSLTLKTMKHQNFNGDTIIWNPGTGHIPAAVLTSVDKKPKSLILAGNDLLQLKASENNIRYANLRLMHLPTMESLSTRLPERSIDFIIANPVQITGAGIEEELMRASARLLRKGGRLLAAGRSSDISRLDKYKKGFTEISSEKFRGFRVLLLEKLS
ncbi:MAG: methyltransferase [Spirochaetales bacterium]|nr:methyltransferase [Spirochaetales bacterium]